MSSGGIPLTATSVVRAGEAYSVESLNRLATQHRELEAIVRDLAAATVDVDVAGVQFRAREWVERNGHG